MIIFGLTDHRGHQGVQHAHSEGGTARERLSEIKLSVRIIIIVLVQELNIAVIHQLGDHRDIGAVHGTLPLQNYGGAKR